MVVNVTMRAAPTCVWMDAGVLTYRLCDRDFDCAHCPLNAALRGTALAPTVEGFDTDRCDPRRADSQRAGLAARDERRR